MLAVGSATLLAASLQTGGKRRLATKGARSDRGWGEVPVTSNRDRECREFGYSTPDLEHLRRLPRSEGNFRPEHGSRPARGFRGTGCSSGPQSCSWRHPPAEIVRARAASPSPRKRSRKRSSRCLAQRRRSAAVAPAGQPGQGKARGARKGARSSLSRGKAPRSGEAAVIDVPAANRDQAAGRNTARCIQARR